MNPIDGWWSHRPALRPTPVWIPPDGCADLVVQVEGDVVDLRIIGPSSRLGEVVVRPGVAMAGVRFAPGVGPRALGFAGSELVDGAAWARDVAPALARRAAALVHPARPAEGLQRLVAELDLTHPLANPIAALCRGALPVGALARATGTSERTLRRRFLELVGLSPRALAQVLRFQRALAALSGDRSLAEIARVCGYADQAHLTREVRALAGLPPGRLRGRTVQDADGPPGDEAGRRSR